jgi:uncharacterized membrane protein
LSIESPRGKSGPVAIPVSLLVIAAVGAVLRCYRLSQNSLWTDEIASVLTAKERFWAIPAAALRQDAFEPPLYFWLLHVIAGVFGDSEVALRSLSVIAGALTIPLVWLLVWELSRQRQVATLAAAFLALNPLHLWYSQEARPYALMIFFGTAAVVALARALREPTFSLWALFAVFSSLAMLTHVVAVVVPIIALVWVLLRADRARTLRPTLLALGATLVLIAPDYLMLARSIVNATSTGSPGRPLIGLELPYTALTYLGGYSFGPSVREIQDAGWQAAAGRHTVQLSLAGLLLGLWLVLAIARRGTPMTGLLVLCILPAVLAFIGSAATTKAYNVRYTLIGIIGFVASLSAAIMPLRPRLRNAVAISFCIIFIWADVQWFYGRRYRKDDSRAAAAWLGAHVPQGATVVVAPSYAVWGLAHYATRSGNRFCLIGVMTTDDMSRHGTPDALVLTRLYHVENWQVLEGEFNRLSGPSVERGTEVGFRLMARSAAQSSGPSSRPVTCDNSPQGPSTK